MVFGSNEIENLMAWQLVIGSKSSFGYSRLKAGHFEYSFHHSVSFFHFSL